MFQSAANETAGYDLSEIILYAHWCCCFWASRFLPGRPVIIPVRSRSAEPAVRLGLGRCAMIYGSFTAVGRRRFAHYVRMGTHPIEFRLDFAHRRLYGDHAVCAVYVSARRGRVAVVRGLALTALRTAAFLGLLILYLQPHWRLEREVMRNSKAILLVDTSLSMGLSDSESAGTLAGKQPVAPSTRLASNRRNPVVASSGVDAKGNRLHRPAEKNPRVSVFQFNDDLKADSRRDRSTST